jgi:hypothetical protein
MKWLKQTFAARYNRAEGRIGHIWGDRYWSGIVEGEPPEEEGTGGVTVAPDTGVRPHGGKTTGTPVFRSSPPALPRRPTVYTHLGEVLIKHKGKVYSKEGGNGHGDNQF